MKEYTQQESTRFYSEAAAEVLKKSVHVIKGKERENPRERRLDQHTRSLPSVT